MTNTRRQDEQRFFTQGHYEIHEGESYTATLFDETMGDGELITLTFKTPNTNKHIHMLVDWSSKAGGHLQLCEGATWGRLTGGVTSIFNHRRQNPGTSGLLENISQTAFNGNMLLGDTPQSLVNTLVVFSEWLFGTANKGGGARRGIAELILQKDTQYAISVVADGASNAASMTLHWYEHGLFDKVTS